MQLTREQRTCRLARRVHLARPEGPPCGAPRAELVAIDSHNGDRLDWITCPRCRESVLRGCRVLEVEAI